MAAHAVPARRGTAPRRRPRPAHRRLRELPFRLVLAYRWMPPQVRQRIGRGNRAWRSCGWATRRTRGPPPSSRTGHRFVLSQLTETVGTSVTDTTGVSYTSRSASRPRWLPPPPAANRCPAAAGSPARRRAASCRSAAVVRSAETSRSHGSSQSESLTAGISTSTAWGLSTSRAAGDGEWLARSMQRSREFLVEAAELRAAAAHRDDRQLRHGNRTARRARGRQPGDGGLAVATASRSRMRTRWRTTRPPSGGPARPVRCRPPADRLDWRKR